MIDPGSKTEELNRRELVARDVSSTRVNPEEELVLDRGVEPNFTEEDKRKEEDSPECQEK
jgi:hypothetical protein